MKMKVDEQGVLVPKEFFAGVQEVEIVQENHAIIITPIIATDPILQLGTQPIEDDTTDASSNHDRYIYSV